MGCFDSYMAECPLCGTEEELQSKAGDCSCARYKGERAPVVILADLKGEVWECAGCKRKLKLTVQVQSSVVVQA